MTHRLIARLVPALFASVLLALILNASPANAAPPGSGPGYESNGDLAVAFSRKRALRCRSHPVGDAVCDSGASAVERARSAPPTGQRIAIAVRSFGVYHEVRWTDWSEDHIRRHDVAAGEVEQVLFSRPRWIAKGREGTTLIFGSTTSGRPLLVVTVDEGGGVVFVVTAREMTEQEKRTFRRKAR
jgi:hypothetical protein